MHARRARRLSDRVTPRSLCAKLLRTARALGCARPRLLSPRCSASSPSSAARSGPRSLAVRHSRSNSGSACASSSPSPCAALETVCRAASGAADVRPSSLNLVVLLLSGEFIEPTPSFRFAPTERLRAARAVASWQRRSRHSVPCPVRSARCCCMIWTMFSTTFENAPSQESGSAFLRCRQAGHSVASLLACGLGSRHARLGARGAARLREKGARGVPTGVTGPGRQSSAVRVPSQLVCVCLRERERAREGEGACV
jgi:hypothetical protein